MLRAVLLSTLTLLAEPAVASPSGELEREAARVAAERGRAHGERQRLLQTAGPLADEIATLKQPAAAGRAGPDLSQRLREFDPVAKRLDQIEGQLAELDRRLARLRSRFEEAARLDERRLDERARGEGAAAVAGERAALAAARGRMAALGATTGFRPPLEIAIEALDGPPELEAKLAIIDGERARLAKRLAELRREQTLLVARSEAGRQWARELGAARRDAGGGVEALEQAYERAEANLVELAAQMATLAREGEALRHGDERLAARRREAEQRLRSLATRQETR